MVSRIAELGVDEGFDALEGRFGNMIEIGIIDPLRVARAALQNGASVTYDTSVADEIAQGCKIGHVGIRRVQSAQRYCDLAHRIRRHSRVS